MMPEDEGLEEQDGVPKAGVGYVPIARLRLEMDPDTGNLRVAVEARETVIEWLNKDVRGVLAGLVRARLEDCTLLPDDIDRALAQRTCNQEAPAEPAKPLPQVIRPAGFQDGAMGDLGGGSRG